MRVEAGPGSTKAGSFEQIAERRVSQAIKMLRLIGDVANKRNYACSEEQAKQIVDALEAEVRQVKARFRQEASTERVGFSFRT